MTRIDVGLVLRDAAHLPYTNLVTRSTGAAVRRCIELELAALSIVMDGAPVKEIAVTPGETVTFVLTNTANAPENFWIGTDAQLGSNQTVGLPEIGRAHV